MLDNVTTQLIAFFVATTISVTSSHVGLVRLIGSADDDKHSALKLEKSGVLVVVEFALVILIGAPLPIAARLLDPNGIDHFAFASWIIPFVTFVLAFVDLLLSKCYGGWYYNVVVVSALLLSAGMLAVYCCGSLPRVVIFFSALGLSLLIIAAQFFKTALRFSRG